MVGAITVLDHLHKLVVVKSEQEIERLLQLLWRTRKTGLTASQKSSIQLLLKLPSPHDLDPVLASLRMVMRNYVHKNLEGEDALKLLPPDLPIELQSMLLILLQKHQSHWKEEMSQEKHAFEWTSLSHQVNVGLSAPILPFFSSAASGPFFPLQFHPVPHLNAQNLGGTTPITAERNAACSTLQNDVPSENLGVFPRVKSMNWTVETRSEMSTHRVAIITLKLQDYTKSPSNEMEVQFQLTRDTLEAVLRSMTYISDQLSHYVRSSSIPLQKKQKL